MSQFESARQFLRQARNSAGSGGFVMVSNVLRHKGYVAEIGYDESADAFHGRVIGIRDVIDFYGRTPDELRGEFKAAIEEYLAWCKEEGDKPRRPGSASSPSGRPTSSVAGSSPRPRPAG